MAEYIDKKKVENITWQEPYYHDPINVLSEVRDKVRELTPADVVERDKVKQAIEEIEQTLYVDSLIFGELIDFKDGKISADDVIEEFNRVTRKEVLEIIKRNIGELENEVKE